MAFEDLKENTEQIHSETQAYIDSTVAYYKLWRFKVMMKSTTLTVKIVLTTICFMMMFLFGSVALALAIGSTLKSNMWGFAVVGGIYLILTIIFALIKQQIVEGAVLRKFSEIFFND